MIVVEAEATLDIGVVFVVGVLVGVVVLMVLLAMEHSAKEVRCCRAGAVDVDGVSAVDWGHCR